MDIYIDSLTRSFSFLFTLISANLLFLHRFDLQPRFLLRFLSTLVAGWLLTALLFTVRNETLLLNAISFSFTLALSVLIAKVCFVISWSDSVFCAVAGYSVQFVYSLLSEFAFTVLHLPPVYDLVYEILSFTVVFVVMYLLFGRQIHKGQNLDLNNRAQLGLLLATVLIEILLCNFLRQSWHASGNLLYTGSAMLLLLICTVAILIIQFSLLRQRKLASELDIVYQMWRKEQNQYQISKEIIDTVNRKCHDMRHQIHTIGRSAQIDPAALEEMEDAIDIYDALYQTGSKALDIILAEKGLLCQNSGIDIHCMADGEKLRFMSDTDIYSLFGNLLDNAIRAVQELDAEQQAIGLSVVCHGALLSINSHNRYAGEITFENGIPVTASTDTMNRGFGVKSIVMIVQKYGGTVSFQAKDGMFNLNILFPLDNEP